MTFSVGQKGKQGRYLVRCPLRNSVAVRSCVGQKRLFIGAVEHGGDYQGSGVSIVVM